MIENNNIRPSRRILYVDASFHKENGESKICLYDLDEDKTNIFKTMLPSSSSFAERYAIVYGCLYAKRLNNLDGKRIHILCDNYGATIHTKIKELCSFLNISLSWIPREINTIADRGTSEDCNISNEDVSIYDLFYELIIEQNLINKTDDSKDKIAIKTDNNGKTEREILIKAIKDFETENEPYVALGVLGKYLKDSYPTLIYTSLKKLLEKYPNEFEIVNNQYVKLIQN